MSGGRLAHAPISKTRDPSFKWILRTQSIRSSELQLIETKKPSGTRGNRHTPRAKYNRLLVIEFTCSKYRPKRHYCGSGHGEGASQHPHPPRPHEHSYLHDYLPIPRLLLEAPEATLCRNCPVEPLALHPGFRDLSGCAASDDLHLNHAPVTCKCCSHPVEE